MLINRRLLANFDWTLVLLLALILAFGLLTVYSGSRSLGLGAYYLYRQIIWVIIGIGLMLIITFVDYRFFAKLGLWIHLAVTFLLVLTLVYGTGSSNSNVERWLKVGPIFLQTSEFAKISIVLCLASYLKDSRRFGQISIQNLAWIACLIFVPFILIIRQPDLGTAIIYLVIALTMLFFGGLSYRVIFIALAVLIISIPQVWEFGLSDYQKKRVVSLFGDNTDNLGQDYHITQSVIAIGSSGYFGKGYLQGTQAQLNFLPARHTDFIFALFAEEWGFFGALFLLLLYSLFIWRAVSQLGNLKMALSNLLLVGAVSVIAFHILVNMLMVIRIFPVVGIPLPFFSYGGSAMLTMMMAVGFIMNVKCRRYEDF